MNKYRVIKEFDKDELSQELTARQIISEIENLLPDAYDLPIVCAICKDSSPECQIFDIEIDRPSIVLLIDTAGRFKSVHLFAK